METDLLGSVFGPTLIGFWAMLQCIIIGISLLLIYRQVKLQRYANMLNSIDFMDKRWKTETMVQSRISVCKKFKSRNRAIDEIDQHVIGFFEELGLYLKKGVFDIDVVWELYCDYVEKYWPITEPNIKDLRAKRNDKTYYWNFEYLYVEIDKKSKKNDCPIHPKTENQVLEYIDYELNNLVGKGEPVSAT